MAASLSALLAATTPGVSLSEMVCDSVDREVVTDSVGLELDEPEIDPGHGGLHTWATLCLDCVYVYVEKLADGTTTTIREWNTPKAVEDMAALAPRAPVTLLHPPVNLSPANVGKYTVGDMSGEYAVVDGDEEAGPDGSKYKRKRALVPMTVRTAAGQQAATTDARFTSPGYKPVRVNEPGVHPLDGPYDRKRVGVEWVNHVALVPNPRGGTECALALDGLDADEMQAALDAARPMGYAVAGALNACSATLPHARRTVKRVLIEDSMTPTAEEIQALVTNMLELIKDDEDQLRSLFDSLSWTTAFRALQTKVLLELMGASVPAGAATDATPAMDAMVKSALDAYLKPTTDSLGELKATCDSLKARMDAMEAELAASKKSAMDARAELDARIAATDSKATLAAADARSARDAATTACTTATSALDSAATLKASADARDAADAAAATGRKIAEARHLATTFGMDKTAADAADLPALAAHLRKRRVGGVLETDSDDAVVAAARAASQGRPKPILATDSAGAKPAHVSAVAALG